MIPTASHTTGPFFPAAFIRPDDNDLTVARDGRPIVGERIELDGRVFDALGDPVVNAILELWQADPSGRYPIAGDPFKGWGRTWSDGDGRYRFRTVKPGAVALEGQGGWVRPPHLAIMVLGSGLMRPLGTELFFPGEPLNETDRQLLAVADLEARRRLILSPTGVPGGFRLDLHLGGERETPFLVD